MLLYYHYYSNIIILYYYSNFNIYILLQQQLAVITWQDTDLFYIFMALKISPLTTMTGFCSGILPIHSDRQSFSLHLKHPFDINMNKLCYFSVTIKKKKKRPSLKTVPKDLSATKMLYPCSAYRMYIFRRLWEMFISGQLS